MVGRARGKENVQYKAKEREMFFRRLDRGGTIRAVAAELGFSVDSCYRWRREASVSTLRPKNRSYTAEDKAEFFLRLALSYLIVDCKSGASTQLLQFDSENRSSPLNRPF